MSDRHDIAFREASGPGANPPGLLSELRDLVEQLFPDVAESGVRWVKGKGEQEVAKAAEIRARALEMLGRLDLERQRLIQERDAALRDDLNERARDEMADKQRMYELRTQRLQAVIESVKALKEMGVALDARTTKKIGDLIVGSLRNDE